MKNLILIIILVISLAWNWYFIYQELLQKKELIVENKGEKKWKTYLNMSLKVLSRMQIIKNLDLLNSARTLVTLALVGC